MRFGRHLAAFTRRGARYVTGLAKDDVNGAGHHSSGNQKQYSAQMNVVAMPVRRPFGIVHLAGDGSDRYLI